MKVQHRTSEGIYRRVTVRMYGDERFARLSPLQPSGQALWIYLLTGPHTGPIPGVFVAGRAALAETLGWTTEAFAKAFAEVLTEGLVRFDEKTRLCFIPNAVRHNAPPNPNVVKSWHAYWSMLPECEMRGAIYEHLHAALTDVSKAFVEAFEKACGKATEMSLPNPSGKITAKQDAGSSMQDQSADAVASAPGAAPPVDTSLEELAKSDVWKAAVAVLQQGGCAVEAACRSFMGKLVKDYTFPTVQEAVAAAVTAQPADAREYLKAACQRIAGERKATTDRFGKPLPGVGTVVGETTPEYLVRRAREKVQEDAVQARAQSPASLAAKQAAIARIHGTKPRAQDVSRSFMDSSFQTTNLVSKAW